LNECLFSLSGIFNQAPDLSEFVWVEYERVLRQQAVMFCIFFAMLGTLFGSFINVIITRLPVKGKFLSESRSCCPQCGHVIRWFDLVPVLSWIILRGKCRDCKARISPRYPLVEATCALLAVTSIMRFGFTLTAIQVYGITIILLAIAAIDFNTTEIPNSLIIALIPFAVAAVWLIPEVTLLSHVIGFFCVALPLLLLTIIIPGAFGGGDIKLLAVCGFLLGWQMTLIAFFISLLLGGGFAVYLMLSGRRKRGEHMVFGPAICIGIAVSIYFGRNILDFYLQFFGL
jgi:leader peptidase (prepilin peptidase)/N-methyltransferase